MAVADADEVERALLEELSGRRCKPEGLARLTGIAPAEVSAGLTILELRRVVRRTEYGFYERVL